jgi:hypothetical protein
MPSTYSPLKIELPATGEQSGTWGNTTNTNLGTALEEAIVGSASVTFASGNVTLTLTDTNASQPARNLRLNLIGVTGGSTRTLTVPAIEKLYLVSNNCADPITVGNTTGATVTVPAGNNIFIYNDGTDVLNAITYITALNAVSVSAGTVNAVTVDTTNIEVTNIKAKDGTASATIADSTGVMTVASSVLTTTDINGGTIDGTTIGASTPAAGTFTTATATTGNITTVNATDVDTTSLEVTNLKAKDGTASATIANSTGVMTVGSSVLTTTDINGGTIDGTTIGASTPAAGNFTTLGASGVATFSAGTVSAPAITTTGDTNTGIFFPAADTIAFTEGGVEAMRIDSSGNCGIGTSSPAGKLQVKLGTNLNLSVVEVSSITSIVALNDAASGTVPLRFDGSDLRLATGGNERMRIDSSGNVGINTNTPVGKLQVDVSTSATVTNTLTLNNSAGGAGSGVAINFYASNAPQPFSARINSLDDANFGYHLVFSTKPPGTPGAGALTERMRITSGGSVGINVSTNLTALLNFPQSNYGEAINYFTAPTEANRSGVGKYVGEIRHYLPAADFFSWRTGGASGTEQMRLNSTGLGIGANSPTAKLTINTGASSGIHIFRSDANANFDAIVFRNSANNANQSKIGWNGDDLRFESTGNTLFETNGSERMRITSAGKLLVNTPTAFGTISSSASFSNGTTWATSAAISTAGSFGGGIALVDGTKGYAQYCSDNGNDFYIQGGDVGSAIGGGVVLNDFATSWSSASDENVKDIIEPITNALQKISTLRTVIGKYKYESENKRHPFLIAQDVQAVLPEAVSVIHKGEENECLGLSYTDTIPLLVAAIKELKTEFEAYKATHP